MSNGIQIICEEQISVRTSTLGWQYRVVNAAGVKIGRAGVYHAENYPEDQRYVVWYRGKVVSEPFDDPEDAKKYVETVFRMGENFEQ